MLRIVSHGPFEERGEGDMKEAYSLFWRKGIDGKESGAGLALSREELLSVVADFVEMSEGDRTWRKRR